MHQTIPPLFAASISLPGPAGGGLAATYYINLFHGWEWLNGAAQSSLWIGKQ
jgi:hypothetical protein